MMRVGKVHGVHLDHGSALQCQTALGSSERTGMHFSALGSWECTGMHFSALGSWQCTGIDESALSSPQCTEIMGMHWDE